MSTLNNSRGRFMYAVRRIIHKPDGTILHEFFAVRSDRRILRRETLYAGSSDNHMRIHTTAWKRFGLLKIGESPESWHSKLLSNMDYRAYHPNLREP